MHSINNEAYNILNSLNNNKSRYLKETDRKALNDDITKLREKLTSKSVINFPSNPSFSIPRPIMTSNSSCKPVSNKIDNEWKCLMLDKRFISKREDRTLNEKLSNKYKSFLTQNIPKLLEKYSV
jgi:hypothetical protein